MDYYNNDKDDDLILEFLIAVGTVFNKIIVESVFQRGNKWRFILNGDFSTKMRNKFLWGYRN